MIKVLVITTVKIGFDGLTNHIFSYFKNIDKKDMQIDLVSARGIDEKIKPQLEDIGFNKIIRLEYRDKHQIKYYKQLKKLIKENKYDIVHVHGNSATLAVDMLAAKRAGVKVRIAHSHNTSCDHKIINGVLKRIFRRIYTDGFACGTEAGKWLFGNKEFTVIPNGKEIELYKYNSKIRERIRKELGINKETIAIGNVAAFVEKKNHIFLIEMFKKMIEKHQKYELFLFGIEGETLNSILEKIKEYKLEEKVHYMGTKTNIQDYLQAMDIMLLPSFYEGFPISVIEWQINGLPCLLSNTITQDCNITGNVRFLPIDNGVDAWINEIEKIDISSEKRNIDYSIFEKKGFDIIANSKMLKKKYIELYEKRKNN